MKTLLLATLFIAACDRDVAKTPPPAPPVETPTLPSPEYRVPDTNIEIPITSPADLAEDVPDLGTSPDLIPAPLPPCEKPYGDDDHYDHDSCDRGADTDSNGKR